MLDQSFSTENLRRIFDYENRRGLYLEGRFFPELVRITLSIKAKVGEIRDHKRNRAGMPLRAFEATLETLKQEKKDLEAEKEKLLTKEILGVSIEIGNKAFSLGITSATLPSGKTAYVTSNTPEAFFALKQVQRNLRKLYKVKQANRHNIVRQLQGVLVGKVKKTIVRTDVSDFYESIPSEKLLEKINSEPLLALESKKVIKQVLYEYWRLAGTQHGIPRGIGISAYLAELYMRDFDKVISDNPSVSYYARYVDDIVIVWASKPDEKLRPFFRLLSEAFCDWGLKRNREKTEILHYSSDSTVSLQYLGYNLSLSAGKVDIKLPRSRVERYENRIDLVFSAYNSEKLRNERKARSRLVKRLRYLTSNTRLHNNKRNAVVGVFFSHSLLTSTDQLTGLDAYLGAMLGRLANPAVIKRTNSFSFERGFVERRFSRFTESDLRMIVEPWKHA